jgi:hypothetical protein
MSPSPQQIADTGGPAISPRPGALIPLMDISAAAGYSKDIAPESWQLHPDQGAVQDRSFLIRLALKMRRSLEKGKSPRELLPSHRDLSRRTGYPVRQFRH